MRVLKKGTGSEHMRAFTSQSGSREVPVPFFNTLSCTSAARIAIMRLRLSATRSSAPSIARFPRSAVFDPSSMSPAFATIF